MSSPPAVTLKHVYPGTDYCGDKKVNRLALIYRNSGFSSSVVDLAYKIAKLNAGIALGVLIQGTFHLPTNAVYNVNESTFGRKMHI